MAYGAGVALRASALPALWAARWWSRRSPAPHALSSLGEQARWSLGLASKVALDEFFFATEVAASAFVSVREHRRLGDEIREAVDFYHERGWLEEPAGYHVTPPALEEVESRRERTLWGRYTTLSFDSGYAPHPGEPGRDRWMAHARNRRAHAWLLEHAGPERPWVVCVPGYRMGHPMVDFTGFRARWLHRELGLNVAIPVMPLHGPRRSGRRGGDGFFSGDFVDTVHAQAQAVWDLRRLHDWLRRRRGPGIAVYGVSLGAHTAALLGGVEGRIDCLIAGIPAADFMGLVRSHMPPPLTWLADRFAFPLTELEQLLRVVSPLAFPPRVGRERCFLYAAEADSLATPDHAHALWTHWQQPRIEWYRGGHVSFVWEPQVEALVREAFRQTGLVPQDGAEPPSLRST